MRTEARHDNRIASLDILRVVAALAVVLFHYLFREPVVRGAPEMAVFPAIFGYLGVNLFFMISGFVIAMSAEGRTAWQFGVARFSRIYPGFVACMAITFLVLLAAGDPTYPVSFAQFFANLAILSPALGQEFVDGVYWSIVLELIFYGWVTLAIIAGVFDRHRLPIVAGWLVLASANEFWLEHESLRLVLVTQYAGYFCAGMILEQIRAKGPTSGAIALFGLAFLVSTATLDVTRDWMQMHYGMAVEPTALVLANIGIFAVMLAAVFGPAFKPSRMIALLGALTYPFYLLHQNIGYVAIGWLEPIIGRWLAIGTALGVVLLLSLAVVLLVERPVGRLLKVAFNRLSRRGAVTVPARRFPRIA